MLKQVAMPESASSPVGCSAAAAALHKLHTIFCGIYFRSFYFTPSNTNHTTTGEGKKKALALFALELHMSVG